MKFLLLFVLFLGGCLGGCTEVERVQVHVKGTSTDGLPKGVSYFEHEGNRCYVVFSQGLSCVRMEK